MNVHSDLIRRRRPSTLLIGLLAGAALISAGLAVSGPASAAPAGEERAATAPSEQTVIWTQKIAPLELFLPVQKHVCPSGLRLSDHDYSPAWRIPNGLEIQQSNPNPLFDADIWPIWSGSTDGPQIGAGGLLSTVSNAFGGGQTLTFVLHCV